jgi:hypothetical protein
MKTILMAMMAALALASSGVEARGRGDGERGTMTPTGVDPDARGRVKLKIRDASDGRFEVEVKKLDARASYDLLVDGVRVGAIVTSGGGAGRARFRSRPRGKDELLGFDPRGALVSVRNGAGEDVLAIMLAARPSDDGDVVCCIPDDRGPECEDRTPAECEAAGGTVSTATSCLPDPCADVPPPPGGDVVCCIADDSGPECEDRTPAECSAAGGVVVEAATCDPNPCQSTVPPPGGDIRCCLADDSGSECEDRTPAECAVEGGVNAGAGVCASDACDSTPPPPATGTVRVRCERRADRSRVSVDGNDLAPATYQARITSGANTATAPGRPTIGDEVEFDFDSEGDDVAAGATAIAVDFIQGTPAQVTGAIITPSGAMVAEATVDCEAR